MSYIMIGDEAFATDTDEQISAARVALRAAGLEKADDWAGVPDGAGDNYRTGHVLYAASPATRRSADVEAQYEVDGEVVCTLPELLEVNEGLDDGDREALRALKVGETHELGGGAWAVCAVRRIS